MNKARKIRVLLVDDHFFVRKGLAASLAEDPGLTVVAEARNGAEALELYAQHLPDVTLMDVIMGELDGLATLERLRSSHPEARVLMLSVDECEEDVFQAMAHGACGYLSKSVGRTELLEAIRKVHAGEQYLPENLARRLSARMERPALSPRELTVLTRLVAGRSNKEIAADLKLSELTVRQYVSAVLEKLGVADRTQAVTAAVQRGLVRL